MVENSVLNVECSEGKKELIVVKEELETLKRVKNVNLDNFMRWTSDEFVDWIVSLEVGKYNKYETQLRTVFKEEEVDGSVIATIEKSEWKEWGVTNYKDRMNLDKHLQSLVTPRVWNSVKVDPRACNKNTGDEGIQENKI